MPGGTQPIRIIEGPGSSPDDPIHVSGGGGGGGPLTDYSTESTLALIAAASADQIDLLDAILAGQATQTTLGAVLTALSPLATASLQGDQIQFLQDISDFLEQVTVYTSALDIPLSDIQSQLGTLATQTTLAAILAKIIASPATEATLALIKAKTDNIDVALSTRTKAADVQAVAGTVNVGTLPKAREDSVPMSWVSAVVTAPAANVIIADTGALAAGDYDFDVTMAIADTTLTAGKVLLLEHRNAANNATLQTLAICVQQGAIDKQIRRYTLALNERVRIIQGAVAGLAASRYVGAIGRRIS